MIPGAPRRTIGYLAFYALWALLAAAPILWLAIQSEPLVSVPVTLAVVAVTLGVGLPIPVKAEPVSWRRMRRARNAALSAAVLLSLLDVTGIVLTLMMMRNFHPA